MADIGRGPSNPGGPDRERPDRDGSERGTDRGQLMLVAALAIAVAMVVLVVLLNGAIYTQNLAMRSPDTGAHDALQFRSASVDAVGTIIDAENGAEYDSPGAVRENVSQGIERYAFLAAHAHLTASASYATINESTLTLHDGTLLRQTDGSRNFTNRSGDSHWTLASTTPDVRQFDINITDSSLLLVTATPADDAFNVTVRGSSGKEWSLYVYQDAGTKIAVKNGSEGSPAAVCTGLLAPEPRIGVTEGTVDGDSCSALEFAKGVSPPYNVSYTNGEDAVGTYNLTVNTTSGVVVGNFVGPDSGNSPYHVPAVYDATFVLVYETPALTYTDHIRVAPDEPP